MTTSSVIKKIDKCFVATSPWTLFILLLFPALEVSKRDSWLAAAMLLTAAIFIARGAKWLRFLVLPFAAISILQFGYYLYSEQEIDKFFWMAIESTERAEAVSFIAALTPLQVATFAAYIIICAYLVFCIFRADNCAFSLEKAVAVLVCMTVAYEVHPVQTVFGDTTVHGVIGDGYYGHVVTSLEQAHEFRISPVPMHVVESPQGPLANQILVVIGESASRLRMGVYGYPRNTTPLIGNNALVFNNDIAVGLNTQPNVQTLLTGLLHISVQGVDQDIFRAARSAAYTSIVIDNNGFENDDPVVRLSMQATQYISMNGVGVDSPSTADQIKHDQVVIKPFIHQIKLFGGHKTLYLIHLMGSHPVQKLRYPNAFNKFPSYYDNSILYTNYIISELRRILMEHAKGSAVMIYVADHGVGLPPGCGMRKIPDPEHASYGADNKYFSNYAVPLIVWTNSDFRMHNPRIVDS
ncbi:MAG: sulfatase-like hydrolase/transferase, partial [Candidatus Micrarchaeaceae archaeon]